MEQIAKRRRIGGDEEDEEFNPLFINPWLLHCSESSEKMRATECGASMAPSDKEKNKKGAKPQFVPAKDDSKPVLQDPILRSDPIETEEAVLRLPPFSLFPDHQEKARH